MILIDIDTFCKDYNLSRSSFYREINNGRLDVIKRGRRTFVTKTAAAAWLQKLETATQVGPTGV